MKDPPLVAGRMQEDVDPPTHLALPEWPGVGCGRDPRVHRPHRLDFNIQLVRAHDVRYVCASLPVQSYQQQLVGSPHFIYYLLSK